MMSPYEDDHSVNMNVVNGADISLALHSLFIDKKYLRRIREIYTKSLIHPNNEVHVIYTLQTTATRV